MKLGVLGGTFDPVHLGHLILAEGACYQLALDHVLWVLTPSPPHKPGNRILKWEDRLNMLSISLAGNPAFEISYVDIHRQPPHYALETIMLLRQQYKEDQLILLMGSDSLRDLPGWYHPNELVKACDGLGVMKRSEASIDDNLLERQIPGILHKLHYLSIPYIDISSSEIRYRVSCNKPYRYFLLPEVYEYIRQNRLYVTKTETKRNRKLLG